MSEADRSLLWFMFMMLTASIAHGWVSLVCLVAGVGWFVFYLVEDRHERAGRRR